MIKVSNLIKTYGSHKAVSSISFSVEKGTICGFLGMNGAGKTTTMRMLTGIIEPSSGEIILGSYNIKEFPNEAKKICGYIPDRPYLYPNMTPIEFLSFTGSLYEMPISKIAKNSEDLLKHFSLWEKRNDLIQGFSHGMKQRLATSAALLHEPEVLIIDEPMVGLDPPGAENLKQTLRKCANEGMTIFLSTHSLNVAEELCDIILIIHEGSILAKGSVSQIKDELAKDNSKYKSSSPISSLSLEKVFIELTKNYI